MAQGDTNVTVCNKALLLLGAEPITSFSDGTPAAQACSTIYEDTITHKKKLFLSEQNLGHLSSDRF